MVKMYLGVTFQSYTFPWTVLPSGNHYAMTILLGWGKDE